MCSAHLTPWNAARTGFQTSTHILMGNPMRAFSFFCSFNLVCGIVYKAQIFTLLESKSARNTKESGYFSGISSIISMPETAPGGVAPNIRRPGVVRISRKGHLLCSQRKLENAKLNTSTLRTRLTRHHQPEVNLNLPSRPSLATAMHLRRCN